MDTVDVLRTAHANGVYLMQVLPQFVSGCVLVAVLALLVWRYTWR